jgi:hypothetical protein
VIHDQFLYDYIGLPDILTLPYGLEYPEGFLERRRISLFVGFIPNSQSDQLIPLKEFNRLLKSILDTAKLATEEVTLIPSPLGIRVYGFQKEPDKDYCIRLNIERRRIVGSYLRKSRKERSERKYS